jgi:hypothetical protein
MAVDLKIKRGTRAQLEAAATGSNLKAGEPYLITDEARFAIGLSASTYEEFAKLSEAGAGDTDLDYGLITSSATSTADYGSIV